MRQVRAYAHRGGTETAPENSLAAFQAAAAAGYVDLETDVRGTRDGVAVLCHDATLDRTTDRTGRVRDLTWSEVRRARIGGTEPMLRLEELLEALPDQRVNLDLKEPAAIAPLADALARTGAQDRVCLTSFSTVRLQAARRALPGVATAAGPREVLAALAASRGRGGHPRRPARLQVPERVFGRRLLDRRFLDSAQSAGLPVDVWTVNERADMERLLDWGVDGLMTDRPALLREVMVERGCWEGREA